MPQLNDVHYDAFISYRHSELDSFVAGKLHRKLENFKLPKSVRSKAKNGKDRIERVFRDTEELPLSDNLSDPISNALANSDFLITICTPRYPQSRWCMKEIEIFLKTHSRDHILVVLAEDEPANSFPEILNYADVEEVDENGNVTVKKVPVEPLGADTRGSNRKEIMKAMDTAVTKLCAAIFGLNYDDLKQRRREQKLRKMALIGGSISAAILAFAIFATIMLIKISHQNVIINRQYGELQDKYAGSMAAAAEDLMGIGRRKDAVYALRSVLPDSCDNPNEKALRELYLALDVYDTGEGLIPLTTYDAGSQIIDLRISCDKCHIAIYSANSVKIFDVESGSCLSEIDILDDEYDVSFDFCSDSAILISDDSGTTWHTLDGTGKKDIPLDGHPEFWQSDDGQVTVAYADDYIYGISGDGSILYEIDVEEIFDEYGFVTEGVSFDDGHFAIFMDREYMNDFYGIIIADEVSGRVIDCLGNEQEGEITALLEDDILYVALRRYDSVGSRTDVYALDISQMKVLWQQELDGCAVTDISSVRDCLYLCEYGSVIVMNKAYGATLNLYRSDRHIMTSFMADRGFCYMDDEGGVYLTDSDNSYDYSGNMYSIAPDCALTGAVAKDGDLFLIPAGCGHVVRYAPYRLGDIRQIEYADFEYTTEPKKDATDILEKIAGINMGLVNRALYSDDDSLIFISFANHNAWLVDAASFEVLKTLTMGNEIYIDMQRCEATGGYIISSLNSSYLLDGELNILDKTNRVVEFDDDRMIIKSYTDHFYEVGYVDYDELMGRADDYLGSYEPAEDVRSGYNIK